MIAKVITSLGKIENTVSQKLLSIFTNKLEKVEQSYYSNSLFENQENYIKLSNQLNGRIVGSVHRKIVETPLVFIRGKENPVFFAGKDQGIDFGFTMVDYRTSQPLLIVNVEFKDSKFYYKSIIFNKESGQYITSLSKNKNCNDFNTLVDFVLEHLNTDVDFWIDKY
jgi:hypothetical protein